MWKDHIFQKALEPMLQQIDAEYEAFEGEVFSLRTLHDPSFNLSLNRLSPFVATRRSRTWAWWAFVLSSPGCPGSPFMQECTSNIKDYTEPPAWLFKIGS
jgi:hypothetical protein